MAERFREYVHEHLLPGKNWTATRFELESRRQNAKTLLELQRVTTGVTIADFGIFLEEHDLGQFYKVSNKIIPALLNSNLGNLKLSDVKLPFPSIEIRLPEQNEVNDINDAEIRSIIVWERTAIDKWGFKKGHVIAKENPISVRQFVIITQWRTKDTKEVVSELTNQVYFTEHGTLEEAIKRTINADTQNDVRPELTLAFAICLLATGQHKYIEPDVLTIDRELYLNPNSTPQQRQQMAQKAKEKGIKSSLLGFRYVPLPHKPKSNTDPLETGRELFYNHWRTGHFRRIPCGEIRWIEPTLVRPDLPPDPRKRQYIIRPRTVAWL